MRLDDSSGLTATGGYRRGLCHVYQLIFVLFFAYVDFVSHSETSVRVQRVTRNWRSAVVYSLLRKTILIAASLLFPACSIVRQSEQPAALAQPNSMSAAAAESQQGVENSPVVQAAYHQQPDRTEGEPAPIPTENLPAPGPAVEDDADSGPLSLESLEQMALANNPGLAEAAARVEAAQGKWVQAGLPPNPRLGYSGQQLGSGGQAEQQGVYLEQEVIRGGKLRLNREVVSREISHAEQLFEVQRRRVLTDVRIGYYKVLCAQKQLEVSKELVRIGNQATTAAKDLFEKKEGSRRDLLQARIESRMAQTLLQQARNERLAAWRRLAAVLGMPMMPPKTLVGEFEETAAELAWEQSLQRLLSESPEVAAAFVQVERARWAVERARAQTVPDVNLQGIVQHDNATGSANGSLLVAIPIPVLNRNQGGIRQAESELVSAERAADRVALSLQHRLASVFERYLTSRNRVDNFRDGILRDAQESLKLTRQAYEAGELNFLNLLTAQRTYFRANLSYARALCDMWAASSEIEGLLLTNSLEWGGRSGQAEQPVLDSDSNLGLPNMAGQL